MGIVYRTSDRIKLKVSELVVTIGPLTKYQKEKIQSLSLNDKLMDAAGEAIKCGIKNIEGLVLADGSDYVLSFDDNKELTDDCVDDIMNVGESGLISNICASLISGIPDEFVNPYTGKKLEGVEFIKVGGKSEKKPKS
ncbi:hypothetical protein KAR91_80580 [Candidatus Pacearchaeota archaeon]|nr:hypothetical protein [Candidatus Pacearchaeota archaeon]